MTKMANQSSHLKAGEYYGKVSEKRSVSSSIISEVVHNCSRQLPEHSHELAFFCLLIDGSYSESFGRRRLSYRPFSILWHPSGIEHKDEIGENGGRFFGIEIQQEGLRTLKDFASVPPHFYERGTPLVWLACRLYHEFRNWQTCSELVAEGITLEMLGRSARKEAAPEKKPPRWLEKVVDKLSDEFRESPSTNELAEIAGVHPVHLASVFRKFRGETIGEYLQSRRVEYACGKLADRETPLADIAVDAGFSDQSHFTKVFRRSTGLTPGAFRNSLVSP
ncbi:MAG: AraC family transcriptional regulator [Acidobacteria bacterium]|nr:MAG: AraC family transcriptional regulator [Acidobacteriota bacterium]REK02785.1 MAG: AraC family transcriptional regulator [Acidobacteriota bacterium]REK13410.1 MAG: AraC family transcriptional regulator [Acidobacteriota bacterium]REK41404.1 MAG: AraC family transcriptional regulator [Acidobacteriota bacterium]